MAMNCHQGYKVGDHVTHAAAHDGAFPSGPGVVEEAMCWNSGDGHSYKVKCDATGKVLPVIFRETELSPISE